VSDESLHFAITKTFSIYKSYGLIERVLVFAWRRITMNKERLASVKAGRACESACVVSETYSIDGALLF
jgi:hypothetical protein